MNAVGSVLSAALVSLLMMVPALADDTDDFRSATEVSEIQKLGAKQVAGESILQIVSGKTLQHPDWTWTFNRDGTQSSVARDGSWRTEGTWKIQGHQLCRTNAQSGTENCSDVYYLGRDLKFTEGGNRRLADWYASF